jgi:hypothetical protein
MLLSRFHAMVLLVLGCAGMVVALHQRHALLRLCLWLIVGWTLAHLLFWTQPRFRYPLDVPLSILAAAALVQIPDLGRATLVRLRRNR